MESEKGQTTEDFFQLKLQFHKIKKIDNITNFNYFFFLLFLFPFIILFVKKKSVLDEQSTVRDGQ